MKEAQESKCQNLKCKACGKALSLRCHFLCYVFSFVYIGFKQLQYLLHNFYIVSFCMASYMMLFMSLLPLSKLFKFHTSDCYKLGNVHSLQIAMN